MAFVVLNEFPKALRQAFRNNWDNIFGHRPGYKLWDDSSAVRSMFFTTEGGKTRVPTHLPCENWDCTALFQATIFSWSFALPDSRGHHRTLSDLYVRPHRLPHGTFHASVLSPSGNDAETFAMAIDQLRLLRNAFCHSSSSKIAKLTFDQYIQLTKDAFKALGVTSGSVDAVGSLTEQDFPIGKVRKLEENIRNEFKVENTFLKEDVKEELMGIRSDIAQFNQEQQRDAKRGDRKRKKDRQELEKQLALDKEEWKDETLKIRRTMRTITSDIKQSNQEWHEKAKQAAREGKEEMKELKSWLERCAEEWKYETSEVKKTVDKNIAMTASADQETKEKLTQMKQRLDDVLGTKGAGNKLKIII